MKVVRLQISGFKGIATADLTLGDVNVVAGQNGSGKSSVLDALAVALSGSAALPAAPVKVGAPEATIVATLDNGMVIRRKVMPDRRMALAVTYANGSNQPKPQDFLDGLCGSGLAFDPLAFCESKPKVQADMLRSMVGLDTSDLDSKRADTYSERTAVGRQRDTAKGAADSMAYHEGVPETEVSAGELSGELMRANEAANIRADYLRKADWADRLKQQQLESVNELNAELAGLPDRCNAALAEVELDYDTQEAEIREAIAALERKLNGLEVSREETKVKTTARYDDIATDLCSKLAAARGSAEEQESIAVALRLEADKVQVPDADQLRQQIADVDATNRKVRDNRRKTEAQAAWQGLADQYKALTEQLQQLDADKAARVAAVQWPVDGLGFGDDGAVTFRGVPLEQASQAERLRTAMAIGLHTAGEVKVILLREASLMDETSRKMVCDLAKDAGAQIVLEIVGAPDSDEGNCFLMVDGELAYASSPAE